MDHKLKKVIAFDMDKTLSQSKTKLKKDMAEALLRLMGSYKVAVVSGASLPQFERQLLDSLSLSNEHFGQLILLPTNGASMYIRNKELESVYSMELSKEEFDSIFEAFEKMFLEIGFEPITEPFGEILEKRGSQVTFSAFGSSAPLELKETWDQDKAKRHKMIDSLKKYLPDFEIRTGGSTSIDVTRVGIDKSYGIRKMLEHFDLSIDDVLFLGDDMLPHGNDYPVKMMGVETIHVSGPDHTLKEILSLI